MQYLLNSNSQLHRSDHEKIFASNAVDKAIECDSENLNQKKNIGFVCAQSSKESGKEQNPNERIVSELSKLASTYKNSNDQWRSFAYEKAIAAIRRHPNTILNREGK